MAENNVSVSPAAGKRVAKILASEPEMVALRISVEGGGCSGFSYKFDLADAVQDDDLILEREGGKVAIDPISLMYMDGSVVDFVDDLMGQSFQIKNPNATARCGCGTSFSM
ncbi:MAG: iron-sulfur cluster insertion protein ErpA [Ahrensia sp.]|nr:iron-sulfur cluster insertion protein ErpA [Ahrensia sp.]